MPRSFLFVPADNKHKLTKSLGSAADALIVDLEDAVALHNKEAARPVALEFLRGERGGKQIHVRINAFDTGLLLRDLQAVMPGRPDGIMLPKSAGGDDIIKLGLILEGFEACLGFDAGSTKIIPIVTETPQAVLNLASYQQCSARLWGMLWGAEDLAGAIGASGNRKDGRYRSPFHLARDQCLLAAAAADVVAIDAVFIDVHDADGLEREASEARIEGFRAKAAIHPAQCDVINAAFLPTAPEVAWAQAVLAAIAQSAGGGVATLDGKMIDRPHVVQATRILQSAWPEV